jgi:hypothetical protein
MATAGRPLSLTATARDAKGKPVAGVPVTVKGPGVDVTAHTDASGVAHVQLQPPQAGLLTVSAGGGCSEQAGVSSATAIPVTG